MLCKFYLSKACSYMLLKHSYKTYEPFFTGDRENHTLKVHFTPIIILKCILRNTSRKDYGAKVLVGYFYLWFFFFVFGFKKQFLIIFRVICYNCSPSSQKPSLGALKDAKSATVTAYRFQYGGQISRSAIYNWGKVLHLRGKKVKRSKGYIYIYMYTIYTLCIY